MAQQYQETNTPSPSYTTLKNPLASSDPPAHSFSSNHRHTVVILHPGYSDKDNILLTLHAPDISEGGLYYDIAHQAAAIVTGNRFDGYFTHGRAGSRVDLPTGAILRAGRYYFHTGDCCAPAAQSTHPRYPVVPQFESWEFPHDNLPPLWTGPIRNLFSESEGYNISNTSARIAVRDRTCRVTGASLGLEAAHLCPRKQDQWFRGNQMERHNRNNMLAPNQMIDDVTNLLLLRADVHKIFDGWLLIFFPKISGQVQTDVGQITPTLVTHALDANPALVGHWHNQEILEVRGVAVENLFARFAVCIFNLLAGFIASGVERVVLVPSGDGVLEVQTWTPVQCTAVRAARSGSQSPRKRSAPVPESDAFGEAMDGDVADRYKHKRKRPFRTEIDNGNSSPMNADHIDPYNHKGRRMWRRRGNSEPLDNDRAQRQYPDCQPTSSLEINSCIKAPQYPARSSSTSIISSDISSTGATSDAPAHNTPDTPLVFFHEGTTVERGDDCEIDTGDQQYADTGLKNRDKTSILEPLSASALRALAVKHLREERQRSDAKGSWSQRHSWALDMLTEAMTSEDAADVWEILGGDELEEREVEEGVTSGRHCEWKDCAEAPKISTT